MRIFSSLERKYRIVGSTSLRRRIRCAELRSACSSQKGGLPKDPATLAALLGVFHFRAYKSKLLTPSNRKPRYCVPGSLCPEQESNHLFQFSKIGSKTQYSKGFTKVPFLLIYFNYPLFSLLLYLYCTSGTNIDTYFIP